ncbi:hypothetical protein HYDPIDRAFT_172369 [Hydnomerulius pinastri MD-312]|nr:hypothetical protein HYDPIDRAFT_172369 [Hydnomerulius pinastri MD-312]
MSSTPSASQWGMPTSPKRALLIHGLTSSSHTWASIGQSLAEAGYYVVAPNLLGHAYRKGTDYSAKSMAEDLRPYFNTTHYNLIIGHSLGAVVSAHLLPLLHHCHPVTVIMVDPPLEVSAEHAARANAFFSGEATNVRTAEAYLEENPTWTREDAVSRVLGASMCSAHVVQEIFRRNDPWSFGYLLRQVPPNVMATVLVSDPELSDVCRVEHIPAHPRVRSLLVPKVGHWIQHEMPEIIVGAALKSVALVPTAKL